MRRSLVFVFALLVAGCSRRAEKPAAPAALRLVTAVAEEKELSPRVEVEGSVVGREEATLGSRLSAPVARVAAAPGSFVRKGEVLVELETRESDAALEGARAALASAKAAEEVAVRNLSRFEALERRDAAAAVELDRARLDDAAARAQEAAAVSSLRKAETDHRQSVLVSPFDAVVVDKFVSPGDLALPGRPLVRLASRTGRRVEVALSEADVSGVKRGDVLEIAVGGRTVTGPVAEIVGAADPATRRLTVRVDLPGGLDPPVGTFARVTLPGGKRKSLVVPSAAVVRRGGLELVWVVGADGVVSLRYVQTGGEAGARETSIRSGLAAGERVVVDPPADLAAGVKAAP